MRTTSYLMYLAILGGSLSIGYSQLITYNFDTAPVGAPLPFDQTSDGLTAHISGNYSVQVPANVLSGFTPAGFSGNCLSPSTIYQSDLLISFSQSLANISIMYSPEEYATDSSCTMRITAYLGPALVGTSTATIDPPGTWPTGILSFNSAQPFDNVVIHYDHPPVTGGDYGPIFMADNLRVTPVPEPLSTSVVILGLSASIAFLLRKVDTSSHT